MRRFFINENEKPQIGKYVDICGREARHIAMVLRLGPGEILELFDGVGTVYRAEIIKISSASVKALVLDFHREDQRNSPKLVFASGLLKGKKMDFLIQKATELGVHEFWPLQTRYSQKRGNSTRQMERWQRIMLEACKQCNRPLPMQIGALAGFSQLEKNKCSTRVLLWEGENEKTFPDVINTHCDSLCLVIGPEGGFHQEEVDLAGRAGFQTITLGTRILRGETARLDAVRHS